MAKIVISGYYGFDNAGDEAVLYSIIQALKANASKSLDITVLSNNPNSTVQTFEVGSVNRWRLLDVCKTIRKSDLLISGGGSLLQDVTSKRSMLYYLGVVFLARLHRKPVVFYAQGIGPVNGKFNQKLLKWVGNGVDKIFVRDEASKQTLNEIGVNKPSIEVVMDPVVGMKLSNKQWEDAEELIRGEKIPQNKPKVGIYLRHWKNGEAFNSEFAKVINWMGSKGWHPIFVPMHYPDDVDVSRDIARKITVPHTLLTEHYSPQEILAVTRQFDFVIAMRLHGLIMAANAKTPYLGISYDPKIDAFIKATHHGKVFSSEAFDSQLCMEYLEKTLQNLECEKKHLESLENEFVSKAYAPAKFVCELLKL